MTQLEDRLAAERERAMGRPIEIRLKAVGAGREGVDPCQPIHHSKLRDVQRVVVAAREHFPAPVACFVERPPAGVEIRQALRERRDARLPDLKRVGPSRPARVVEDAPQGPDEAIQNMRRRIDDVFLDPDVLAGIGDEDAALGDVAAQRFERQVRGVGVSRARRS